MVIDVLSISVGSLCSSMHGCVNTSVYVTAFHNGLVAQHTSDISLANNCKTGKTPKSNQYNLIKLLPLALCAGSTAVCKCEMTEMNMFCTLITIPKVI